MNNAGNHVVNSTAVTTDTLYHVKVHPDRRCDHGDFADENDENPKPNRIDAHMGDNRISNGNRRHLHREHFEERSEEHTSELQSLMRNSYAVFCLKKKIKKKTT